MPLLLLWGERDPWVVSALGDAAHRQAAGTPTPPLPIILIPAQAPSPKPYSQALSLIPQYIPKPSQACAEECGVDVRRVSIDAGHCPQDEAPRQVNAGLMAFAAELGA